MATSHSDHCFSTTPENATSEEAAAIVAVITHILATERDVTSAHQAARSWAVAGRLESHGLTVTRNRLLQKWNGR